MAGAQDRPSQTLLAPPLPMGQGLRALRVAVILREITLVSCPGDSAAAVPA